MPGGSYLDEIYGLLPYGSEANPMNMEAMDMRPALRLEDEINASRPKRMEPSAGAEYPEGSRVDLGDGTERIYGPNGSFEVRRVPLDTASFGDMTPAPGRVVKKGNVEYDYGPASPGPVNHPRQADPASSSRGAAGPPPGVVPPRGGPSPTEAGRQNPDALTDVSAPTPYYWPGEKGSEWDAYLERPQTPKASRGDTRESLMSEEKNSPVPEDVSGLYEREMARQASLSPEQRVAENAKREFERQQQGLDDMATLSAKQRVQAQQNLDAMLAARKKSQEEIDRLKAQPGWWDRRTTGQKVATYAHAIFSGMLAAFQGSSRNVGLESMQAAIDQDAEERAQEFAQARQGMVDADEVFKLKELVRIRGMEEGKQMILTQMAQYDKNGSMVAAGMAAVQDLEARQAEAETKVLEHNWKKELDLAQIRSAEAQTAARLQQEDINSRRSAGVQYAQIASQERLAKESAKSAKEAAELENTRARTANSQFEAEQHNRADSVIDPLSGNSLGKPKDFDKRDVIQGRVIAYSDLRDRLQDLRDYMKTEGTAGKLSEKRDIINQKRQGIAEVYAKIVDPVGAVSDKSIIAANEVVPDADGWIKRWEHPEASFKSITERADSAMELKAKAEIYGYKPGSLTKQWQARDRQLFGKEGVVDREMIDTKNKLLGIDPDAPKEETYGGPEETPPATVPWTAEDAWGPLPWENR